MVNSTEPKAPKERERCRSPRTGWGSLLEQVRRQVRSEERKKQEKTTQRDPGIGREPPNWG